MLEGDVQISDVGLAEDGITKYIADGFVDDANGCVYQVLKITDEKYPEAYRAGVFGVGLNKCGVTKIGDKYVVFKVVMIHNESTALAHEKFARVFGKRLADSLYTRRN